MNFFKLLIVLGLAGAGYQYWKEHKQAASHEVVAESASSNNGFVALPPAEGADGRSVLVIAAENCPHEDAQRADSLAGDLSGMGIPVVRAHNISFSFSGTDSAVTNRILSVMNGPLPIVIVHGRAKSNPSLEQVVAEYRGS